MIAMLRGILEEKQPDQILLDVGGVGYRVFIAYSTYEKLPASGEKVRILTLTSVREDAFHLYGFATQEEKALFILLNNVNGVGAKLALSALSALSVPSLAAAISQEDLSTLCRIPGVGRKTAQRLVVELKDRLPAAWLSTQGRQHTDDEGKQGKEEAPLASAGEAAYTPSLALLREEITSALLNLGYKRPEVERALAQILTHNPQPGAHVPHEISSVADGLRAALRVLSHQVIS